MKRKTSMLLLTAVFLMILFSPHILWDMFSDQIKVESAEKRELASKPEFAFETLEEYPKAFEAYYNDHIPFRDLLIKSYNSLQYHVFHTSSNDEVILGKDGWLFYGSKTDGTSLQCYDGSLLFTDEELELMAHNLSSAQQQLAEQGTQLVVMIAPSKERIYSEYMPDYFGEPAQVWMVSQAVDYLRLHTDVPVVYPYAELMSYKQAYPDRYLYYQTDTHWNELGAYIGVRAVLAEVGIEIPSLDQLDVRPERFPPQDMADMLNVWGIGERGGFTAKDSSWTQEPETLIEDYAGKMEYRTSGARDLSLFMYRDSFGVNMASHLKHIFNHTTFVLDRIYTPQQVLERKPDVFVLEMTERYVRRLCNRIL